MNEYINKYNIPENDPNLISLKNEIRFCRVGEFFIKSLFIFIYLYKNNKEIIDNNINLFDKDFDFASYFSDEKCLNNFIKIEVHDDVRYAGMIVKQFLEENLDIFIEILIKSDQLSDISNITKSDSKFLKWLENMFGPLLFIKKDFKNKIEKFMNQFFIQ